jgi:hypothetical protein
MVSHGFDFISKAMTSRFEGLTPEVVRKISLLESLLIALIQHGTDATALDTMEREIYGAAGLQ